MSMHLADALSRHAEVELKQLTLSSDWKNINRNTAVFLAKMLFRLPSVVRSFKPDVILFSSMVTAGLSVFLRNTQQASLVAINHGQDVTTPNKWYQSWLATTFKYLDATISVSTATREETVNRGMPLNKAYVLPNGFLPEEPLFPKKSDAKKRLKKILPLNMSKKKILLTVGRLVRRKGHEWFIRNVLPELEHCVYVIIGEGPERENIEKAVSDLNLGERVLLWGKRSDEELKIAYQSSDLFVMPNIKVPGDMEGFGIVLLEANSMGTYVIASRLEGITDVISDYENGRLVSPEEPSEHLATIREVLDMQTWSLGKKARNHVLRKFTWEQVGAKYVETLIKITQLKRKESGHA